MAATVMMYVLPMLLGQTYDLGKEKTGLQIYPSNVQDDAVRIDRHITDSQYRMVENADEMKDFLDVSGKLSLKIKGGLVQVSGEGRYLKDSSSKSNGLEILIKVHFETVTYTIPSSKKPNPDWHLSSPDFLGTHYCRSLTYGGDLVASIRISGSNRNELERIKGAMNLGVKTRGDSFEGDIKGKLELLKQNARDSISMEINYYASVPLNGVSYTVDGLMNLIEDFPDHVMKVNNGLGNPLKMELYPLNFLNEGYPAYFENRGLSNDLDDLETQFDDLRNTRRQLALWIKQIPPTIPDLVRQKIDDFFEKVNCIYSSFVKTIAELNVARGAFTNPIKDAFKAYKCDEYGLYQKYYRKFRALQKEIYKEAPELRPKTGGAHYIRWGYNKCTSNETETTMSGVATASEIHSGGGSPDFLCSPLNIDRVKTDDYFTNYKPSEKDLHLNISSIRYKGTLDRFQKMRGKNLACSHCRSASRTASTMLVGTKSCPVGWIREYEGYLMAPGKEAKGEYICVDKSMSEPNGQVLFGDTGDSRKQDLREVTVVCGSIPCEPYEESKPLDCAVCTI